MRIAIAQINTRPADLEAVKERIVSCSQAAARQGAELLVVPMAALTGPDPVREADQAAFVLDVMGCLEDLAAKVETDCLVPVVTDFEGDPLPEAMLLCEGTVLPLRLLSYARNISTYRKSADLPEGQPSPDLPEFDLGGLHLGVAFTYEDLDDFDDYDFDLDAIIYLAGYGYAADDVSSVLGADLEDNRYVDDARTTHAWLVAAGSLGAYGTQVFTGASFVLDPSGALRASSPSFEEDLLVCDIGKPEGDGPDKEGADPWVGAFGARDGLTPEVYDEGFYLWQTLSLGIHDFVGKLGRQDVVVPLDASFSSQALAVLATDALGPTHVHALIYPVDDQHVSAGLQRLVENLHIESRRLPMRAVAASVVNPEPGAELSPLLVQGIGAANLAAYADELGAVVLSPEDKTGLALGRDINLPSAAVLAPLGDVYRTDVLAIARLRNTISPVFPEIGLGAQDRVELGLDGWPEAGSSIESQVGQVDEILAAHIEGGCDLGALLYSGSAREDVDADLAEAVLDRLAQGEPARVGRVLYLMVSSKTLYDVRTPLGLAWSDRHVQESDEAQEDELEELFRQLADMGDFFQEGAGAEGDDDGDGASGHDVGELLGYLKDFSLGGGFRPHGFGSAGAAGDSDAGEGDSIAGGPDAPDLPPSGSGVSSGQGELPGDWRSPFSEN